MTVQKGSIAKKTAAVALLAFVLATCTSAIWPSAHQLSPGHGPLGAAPPVATAIHQFIGTMTVTVDYYDYCAADRRLVDRQTFTTNATVTVSDPYQTQDGQAEQNPFHLSISPDAYTDGTFGIDSAAVTTTPETGRTLLLQYWNLQWGQSTGNFQGTLVNNHYQTGATGANTFFGTQDLVPCQPQMGQIPMVHSLENGAVLAGTLSPNHVRLEVQAQSISGLRAFHAVLEVAR